MEKRLEGGTEVGNHDDGLPGIKRARYPGEGQKGSRFTESWGLGRHA